MLLPEPCAHDPAAPRRPCAPYRLRRPGRLDYEGKVALLVLVDLGIDPGAPVVDPPRRSRRGGAALRLHRDVSYRLSWPLLSGDVSMTRP